MAGSTINIYLDFELIYCLSLEHLQTLDALASLCKGGRLGTESSVHTVTYLWQKSLFRALIISVDNLG